MQSSQSRKPRQRKSVTRELNLLNPPTGAMWGGIIITIGGKRQGYLFCQVECTIGGTGWELVKCGTDETIYHVRIDGQQLECDCPGGTYHGHCKHSSAVKKLIDLGKLPGSPFRKFMIDAHETPAKAA